MNSFIALQHGEFDSQESLESTLWCLIALREKLLNQNRSFDDAIVNTCIDLVYRELFNDYLVGVGRGVNELSRINIS